MTINSIRKFKDIIVELHLEEGGTISKLEANYTDHTIGDDKCKYCEHFEAPDRCHIVDGLINPNGWCTHFERAPISEKWGKPTTVSPSERGKYKGKSKDELLHAYNALKKSGPHSKGSPEYGRMRELAFAIRAKSGWGKVG